MTRNIAGNNIEEEVSNKVLTVPNAISTIRLLLVPVYLCLLFAGYDIAALVLFSIAALTDCLDGQIARRTHQVSKLGKILDPAVDTILMFTGVLGVVMIGRLPAWFAVLVFAREIFLLIGGGILLKRYSIQVPVIYPGKVATTLLFVGFAGMILNMPIVPGLGLVNVDWLPGFDAAPCSIWIWAIYIGLILQIAVMVCYCIQAWGKLRAYREGGHDAAA